ncbi:uncharacterized protein G2W53_018623 [Senna tora]|uniref:Uncharacterized protein n=1 Tax=Senna tora TaxID=362788 RepID=A0A834U0U6_9FABA|nr:uncharacterized protein G2W53_018623 [Senna tora]
MDPPQMALASVDPSSEVTVANSTAGKIILLYLLGFIVGRKKKRLSIRLSEEGQELNSKGFSGDERAARHEALEVVACHFEAKMTKCP